MKKKRYIIPKLRIHRIADRTNLLAGSPVTPDQAKFIPDDEDKTVGEVPIYDSSGSIISGGPGWHGAF